MILKRGLYLCVGLLSLILGIIGIILPVLPTVPFILLAAFFFARSSDKLHLWLMTHPWFSEALHNWQTKRAMDKSLKRRAMIMTTLSFALSITIVPIIWVKAMLFCMLCGLLLYLWQIPELTE
ncbi:YbaN family protein [Shewanella sp. HL-SH8]|uniref:YbaN family protein n=1 Tax=Shewanella sp. HL-SH8 TaxID=3436242 RepID=UPI003EBB2EE0